jgi:ribonuclease J
MYELAKPKLAIPVHGEFIHTKTHCELALKWGVTKAIQIENGMAVKINSENITDSQQIGFVKSGYLGVDGRSLIDLNSHVIQERKKLKLGGIVHVSFAMNDAFEILSKIKISCVGSYDLKSDREAEELIRKEISLIVKHKAKELKVDSGFGLRFLKKKKKTKKLGEGKIVGEIEKAMRSKLLKIFEDLMGKRPALEVVIHLIN